VQCPPGEEVLQLSQLHLEDLEHLPESQHGEAKQLCQEVVLQLPGAGGLLAEGPQRPGAGKLLAEGPQVLVALGDM
jgi:hypothetical protein